MFDPYFIHAIVLLRASRKCVRNLVLVVTLEMSLKDLSAEFYANVDAADARIAEHMARLSMTS